MRTKQPIEVNNQFENGWLCGFVTGIMIGFVIAFSLGCATPQSVTPEPLPDVEYVEGE